MPTEIYIWLRTGEGGEDFDSDDLEEALRGLPKPAVRLTGAGGGSGGFNYDLALAQGEDLDAWVARLSALLRQQGAGPSTHFAVYPAGWKAGMPYRRGAGCGPG